MDYVQEDMTPRHIAFELCTRFDLDEEVQENIRVRYKTRHTNSWKNTNTQRLSTILTKLGLRFGERDFTRLQVVVLRKEGTEYQKDVTCNSDFMEEAMPEVGRMIREAHHWLPAEQIINLVLDNAGGHGTKEAIVEYQEHLMSQYKVRLIHQIPTSPETNILDLGVWASLQSAVETCHRRMKQDPKALASTIEKVWRDFDSSVFTKVYDRWKNKVLNLIIAGCGDNVNVDSARGLNAVVPICVPNSELQVELLEELGREPDEELDD
jgi:hypothetical protein